MTGTPDILAAPMASVNTAVAPRAIASAAKSAPWAFSPGKATNRSPACTLLLERDMPVTKVAESPINCALAIAATDSSVLLNSSIGLDTCCLLICDQFSFSKKSFFSQWNGIYDCACWCDSL